MPILVRCRCGHEVTVADAMAGRKGRCPECDAVLTIPSGPSRASRSGAFARLARGESPGRRSRLLWLARVFGALALLGFLAIAGGGVFTGVTALRGPGYFQGPLGLFSDLADEAQRSPTLVGAGFIAGGILVGAFVFIVLAGTGQLLRVFASMERSLADIAELLSRRDEN